MDILKTVMIKKKTNPKKGRKEKRRNRRAARMEIKKQDRLELHKRCRQVFII